MMRKMGIVALSCLLILQSGCGPKKPKDLIVGKWQSSEADVLMHVIEFTSDGKLIFAASLGGDEIKVVGKALITKPTATYKFIDDDTIEVEVSPVPGMPPIKQKVKVKFSGEEMEWTDEQNRVVNYNRLKT
jgi:hypothetical protein